MADPLADHTWNPQNPGWLRASVWAAQHAESTSLRHGRVPHDKRRCAAAQIQTPSVAQDADWYGRHGRCCLYYPGDDPADILAFITGLFL